MARSLKIDVWKIDEFIYRKYIYLFFLFFVRKPNKL